jgi:gliding motility-associated-like protein
MSRIVLFLLLLTGIFSPFRAQATHIVGGEMNYRCLGNQQFEVVLTVYRDCYFGVPFFDNPASVGVFDAGGNLITNLLIPYVADDTLRPVLSGDCFVLPPTACVHTTTYRRVVTLPVSPGGYTLAYQRCCRNKTILNIEKPDSTGATFSIYVSEEALDECNSSPVFKEWPPIYICVNEPIVFDHSALDEEGDSIVYRLCTPLNGGTLGNPMPQPPAKPPYSEVIWRDPPYNLDDIMGGIPLTIDPFTGLLTGTPNTIGQFVVGICADEYRNGILISSTRRDFQYNVGLCGTTIAGISAPEFQCGYTVKFFNTSMNADKFLWYFDADGDITATSSAFEPTFTYPDSGTYRVMLIAQPDDKCVDTFYREIRIERLSLDAAFTHKFTECSDSLTLELTNTSSDTISQIVAWEWRLSSGPRVQTSQEFSPTFKIDTAGAWVVTLIVTAANGCRDTARLIFPVRLAKIPWGDTTLRICLGDTILLNPAPIQGVTHIWTPNLYLSAANVPNPLAFPDTTITYKLTTLSMNGLCKDERLLTVEVSPPIVLKPPGDTAVCDSPFQVEGFADRPAAWTWSLSPTFQPVLANGNPALLALDSSARVYVHVRDDSSCEARDSFEVLHLGLEIDLPDTLVLCPGEDFLLELALPDPADTLLSLTWSPDLYFPDGTDQNPVLVRIPDAGNYVLFLEAENQHGCLRSDSVVVAVLDPEAGPEIISWQQCGTYRVTFLLDTPGDFAYQWDFGDPNTPGTTLSGAQVSHIYPGPGLYSLVLHVHSAGGCADTLLFDLDLGEPAIHLDFDWSYLSCADTAMIRFRDLSQNDQSDFIGREWWVDGQFAGEDETLDWLVSGSDSLTVLLILRANDGCVDSLQRRLGVRLINIDLPDTLVVCPGDSLQLNPGGNTDYTYSWAPASLFQDPTAAAPWIQPGSSVLVSVRVVFTNPDTCSLERSIWVELRSPPQVFVPSDTVTCLGAVFLQASVPSGIEVRWFGDAEATQLLSVGPELFQPVPQPRIFYIEFRDNWGCRWLDSVAVRSARVTVALPDILRRCAQDTICIQPLPGGDTIGLVTEWSGPGLFFIRENPAEACILPGSPAFTLLVRVENAEGCMAMDSLAVPAESAFPAVTAVAVPPLIVPGQTTRLSVTQGAGWTYAWEPSASLDDPFAPDPLASPESETLYRVTITDAQGCTAPAQVLVRLASAICEEPYIFIPNTFTPNTDQLNDRLFVRGNFIDELYFIIYDRWGNEVFCTRDKSEGWDGTYKGQLMRSGVFGFYLEARCYDGTVFTKKGNITLLRN